MQEDNKGSIKVRKNHLQIFRSNTCLASRNKISQRYSGSVLFNKFPKTIKEATSLSNFKASSHCLFLCVVSLLFRDGPLEK